MPKKIDPYQYLPQYLNENELAEVLSLPMHSKRQVDRIIEIVDEYGCGDDELKQIIYKAFNVSGA